MIWWYFFVIVEYFLMRIITTILNICIIIIFVIIQVEDLGMSLNVIFRILVLTVPSQYFVAYFTFWQYRLAAILNPGIIFVKD